MRKFGYFLLKMPIFLSIIILQYWSGRRWCARHDWGGTAALETAGGRWFSAGTTSIIILLRKYLPVSAGRGGVFWLAWPAGAWAVQRPRDAFNRKNCKRSEHFLCNHLTSPLTQRMTI